MSKFRLGTVLVLKPTQIMVVASASSIKPDNFRETVASPGGLGIILCACVVEA